MVMTTGARNTSNTRRNSELTIRIEELAEILDISKKTIYNRLSANDDMPPHRKFGRKLLWLRKDVESWLEALPIAA